MLFHPKTLELLLAHKKSRSDTPSHDLLVLLLDNTCFLDMNFLYIILYSYSKKGSKKFLIRLVLEMFIKTEINGIWICLAKNVSENLKKIINENRTKVPEKIGEQKDFIEKLNSSNISEINKSDINKNNDNIGMISKQISIKIPVMKKSNPVELNKTKIVDDIISKVLNSSTQNDNSICLDTSTSENADSEIKSMKKRQKISQSNTLNFLKIENKKPEIIEKFTPLELKNATFIFNRNLLQSETIRKRDDLVNPVKLQFIKHADQRRPPIYQRRGAIVVQRYSYMRIKEILSYDECSSDEWECNSDNLENKSDEEEMSSITDSTTNDSEDWVEDDSSIAEPTVFNKKPTFCFNKVNVEKYFNTGKYLKASLEEVEYIPKNMFEEIKDAIKSQLSIDIISKLYNISQSALVEHINMY